MAMVAIIIAIIIAIIAISIAISGIIAKIIIHHNPALILLCIRDECIIDKGTFPVHFLAKHVVSELKIVKYVEDPTR